MKQRAQKSASRTSSASSPFLVKATPWIFLVAFTIIAVLFARYYQRPAPVPAGSSPQTNKIILSDTQLDRELRLEQLQVARKLMDAFPTNDNALYLAGLVRNDQGDSESALDLWKRSLELDPSRADANESIGYALLLRDRYEEAEGYFRQAVQIDPALDTARQRLATTLFEQGKFAAMIPVLERSKAVTADTHRLLGDARQALQQYAPARTNYEAAIALNPDSMEAYYGLSRVLARLGENAASERHLETFHEIKAESERNARTIRTHFDPLAITTKSVAQTHTDVGRVYLTLGRPREAEKLWLRAAQLDARNTLCRLQLAVIYQQTKRESEALRYYGEVAQLDPNDALVQLNLGRINLKLNRLPDAEKSFREVVRLAPERAEGYSSLARFYLQTDQKLTELGPLLEHVLRLAPEAASYELLAQARARLGDYAGAVAAVDKALQMEPGSAQYLQLRTMLLQRK